MEHGFGGCETTLWWLQKEIKKRKKKKKRKEKERKGKEREKKRERERRIISDRVVLKKDSIEGRDRSWDDREGGSKGIREGGMMEGVGRGEDILVLLGSPLVVSLMH